jgi:hypothetical protein
MLGLDRVDVIFFSVSMFFLRVPNGPHFRTVTAEVFLMCLLSALLSLHPLLDVRRTAQYRDAAGLALI